VSFFPGPGGLIVMIDLRGLSGVVVKAARVALFL